MRFASCTLCISRSACDKDYIYAAQISNNWTGTIQAAIIIHFKSAFEMTIIVQVCQSFLAKEAYSDIAKLCYEGLLCRFVYRPRSQRPGSWNTFRCLEIGMGSSSSRCENGRKLTSGLASK